VRILHVADLHLDTPFRGLGEVNSLLAGQLRDATLDVLDRLVARALKEAGAGRLDAVTFGGDLFDSSLPSLRARRRLSDALQTMCKAGITCILVTGNHDPHDEADFWQKQVVLPEGAHLFSASWDRLPLKRDGKTVGWVVGRSFSRDQDNANPLEGFPPLPRVAEQVPIVGLLHCDVGGSRTEDTGYAPVPLSELIRTSCDAWLLGHIHQAPEKPLCEKPFIDYPGNPQGRDISETGIKGGFLVEVEAGRQATVEKVPLASIIWLRQEFQVEKATGDVELATAVRKELEDQRAVMEGSQFRGLIARAVLKGRARTVTLWRRFSDPNLLHEIQQEAEAPDKKPFLVVERLEAEVRPPMPPREQLLLRDDFIPDLLELLDQARNNLRAAAGGAVEQALQPLDRALGSAEADIRADDPDLVNRVEQIILGHLWDEDEASPEEGSQ